MSRDESFESVPLSEDLGPFYGGQPENPGQSAETKNIQIFPLNKGSRGYSIKQRPIATSGRETKEETFDDVVLGNMIFLRNTAFKLTRHTEDAEDLLQETLLRAYKFFDRYEPGTHPKAWLYRIMKNTHINSYRKSLREPNTDSGEDVELHGGASLIDGFKRIQDPHRALSNKNMMEKINAALSKLPGEFRDALILCLIDGYSYKEVADKMGCPIGTIMSRIHRSRKILQKELGGLSDEINESFFDLPGSDGSDEIQEEAI